MMKSVRLVWGQEVGEAYQVHSGQIIKGFILFAKAI